MNPNWKIFLPVIIALFLNFGCGTAEAVGGYLSGYEEVEPKPTAVSWWSTLAYLLSLVAVFAVVVVMAYFTAKFIGGRFNAYVDRRRQSVRKFTAGTESLCLHS